jgi:hypothetical protein
LDHVGPSLEDDINQMEGTDFKIEPYAVGKLTAKLANRNDYMVLVSFKSFSEVSKAQCGHALIIYCIPTLESLEQNSQKSSTAVRRHHCRKLEPNGGPSFGKCFRCKWATHCSKAWQSLLGAMVTSQSVKLHTRRSEGCWSCSDDSEQGIDKEGVVLHTGFRLASKLKGGSNE